jgi:coenzyme F420-reducing hydrogenase gamma subunit
VDQQSACSACFGNLAGALRDLDQSQRNLLQEKAICIGQDFVENLLPDHELGIGKCTSGAHTVKGCPPGKEAIREFLLENL